MKLLVAIVGPTAVGKSALALSLARVLDSEIVNADSRQVYRYMDIGTAKPTSDEQRAFPHHLIDILDPDETFNLALYQKLAYEHIEDIQKRVPDIQVVLGNHDGNLEPLLPEKVEIIPPSGTSFGDVGLFHGHAWPAPELLECRSLITGHVHPTVAIRDPMGLRMTKQVLLKAPCNGNQLAKTLRKYLGSKNSSLVEPTEAKVNVSQLFIMPSFNQFLGGRPINEKRKKKADAYIGPILRSGCVDMDEAEVYLLDGTFLGTVNQLKPLS